ncbi:MAG TPA: AMP-binding protein, partial [Leptospiraceae bacterium]|nr:AMP-binding protein [Leptospiraceae bacterium]
MIQLDSMPPKFTLYQLIKSAADSHPNAPAQMYRESSTSDFRSKTFSEMFTEIKKISLALNSLGMKKGENVGLIADVGHRWMPVSMGITTIGGVDVPRGTDATQGDLSYIFQHADCRIIFLETVKVYKKIESILSQFKNLKYIVFFEDFSSLKIPSSVQAMTLSELMNKGEALLKNGDGEYHKLAEAVSEPDTATIIYTSGTTGAPKGVVHTQKSLTWEVYYSLKGMDVPPLGVTMG